MASSSSSEPSSPPTVTFHALKAKCIEDIHDGYELYHKINDCKLLMEQRKLEHKKKIKEIRKIGSGIIISEEMHSEYIESTLPSIDEITSELEKLLKLVDKKIDYATSYKLLAEDGFR